MPGGPNDRRECSGHRVLSVRVVFCHQEWNKGADITFSVFPAFLLFNKKITVVAIPRHIATDGGLC